MRKKLKKKKGTKRKKTNAGFYENEKVSDLILLSIFLLKSSKNPATFENILKKCFRISPGSFKFSVLSWPDSRKIDRPLRSLRKKELISGNPKTSFLLTAKGEKIAQEITRRARQAKLL